MHRIFQLYLCNTRWKTSHTFWISCSGLTGGEKCKQLSRIPLAFCLHPVANYEPAPDPHWIKDQQQNRNHMSASGHLTQINCCSRCVKSEDIHPCCRGRHNLRGMCDDKGWCLPGQPGVVDSGVVWGVALSFHLCYWWSILKGNNGGVRGAVTQIFWLLLHTW